MGRPRSRAVPTPTTFELEPEVAFSAPRRNTAEQPADEVVDR
jgi:hypothetical protein